MTKILQEMQAKNNWRDGFPNVSWRSAAECSTVGQQRPEKLDRRWLKDGWVEQQAMMSMQSGDADEPRQQMTAWWSSSARYGGAVWCRHLLYNARRQKGDGFGYLPKKLFSNKGTKLCERKTSAARSVNKPAPYMLLCTRRRTVLRQGRRQTEENAARFQVFCLLHTKSTSQ